MVLITGASGFIGSHLTKLLKESGIPVRVLARSMHAQDKLEELGYEAVFGDITEELSIEHAFDDISIVVHLAAAIRPTKDHTLDEINRIGTRNIVRAAEKAGVKRIIYLSAVSVSQDSSNLYQMSKWGAEEELRSSKELQHIIIRCSLIYGADSDFTETMASIITKFPIIPIFGNGEAKFQPVHVDNVLQSIIKAIESEEIENRRFELGGPDVVTFNELLRTFAIALRKKRRLIHIPMWLARPVVFIMAKIALQRAPLTPIELELLQVDQTADNKDLLEAYEISLIPFRDGLRDTLKNIRRND